MEEKAELLVKPGCKAGSDKCGKCKSLQTTSWPNRYEWDCLIYKVDLEQYDCTGAGPKRCQQCLVAEAQAKELREKIERLEAKIKQLEEELWEQDPDYGK